MYKLHDEGKEQLEAFSVLPIYKDNPLETQHYLNAEQRKSYIATLDKDGKIKDAQGNTCHGKYIFVYKEGVLYLEQKSSTAFTKHHHSDYVAGQNVELAGELLIIKGQIVRINNGSGHYRPSLAKCIPALKLFTEEFFAEYITSSKIPLHFEDHSQINQHTKQQAGLVYYYANDLLTRGVQSSSPIPDDEMREIDRDLRKVISASEVMDSTLEKLGYTASTKYESSAFNSPPAKMQRSFLQVAGELSPDPAKLAEHPTSPLKYFSPGQKSSRFHGISKRIAECKKLPQSPQLEIPAEGSPQSVYASRQESLISIEKSIDSSFPGFFQATADSSPERIGSPRKRRRSDDGDIADEALADKSKVSVPKRLRFNESEPGKASTTSERDSSRDENIVAVPTSSAPLPSLGFAERNIFGFSSPTSFGFK